LGHYYFAVELGNISNTSHSKSCRCGSDDMKTNLGGMMNIKERLEEIRDEIMIRYLEYREKKRIQDIINDKILLKL
jgi:hypothetical protein